MNCLQKNSGSQKSIGRKESLYTRFSRSYYSITLFVRRFPLIKPAVILVFCLYCMPALAFSISARLDSSLLSKDTVNALDKSFKIDISPGVFEYKTEGFLFIYDKRQFSCYGNNCSVFLFAKYDNKYIYMGAVYTSGEIWFYKAANFSLQGPAPMQIVFSHSGGKKMCASQILRNEEPLFSFHSCE
jgi:hypothetical protein